jgi:hypothetical protein
MRDAENGRGPKMGRKGLFGERLFGLIDHRDGNFQLYIRYLYGEPVGIRTRDLLIKSQLLYRLSYGLFEAIVSSSAAL